MSRSAARATASHSSSGVLCSTVRLSGVVSMTGGALTPSPFPTGEGVTRVERRGVSSTFLLPLPAPPSPVGKGVGGLGLRHLRLEGVEHRLFLGGGRKAARTAFRKSVLMSSAVKPWTAARARYSSVEGGVEHRRVVCVHGEKEPGVPEGGGSDARRCPARRRGRHCSSGRSPAAPASRRGIPAASRPR